METYEKLKEAGMTGNEAKVYLELCEKGSLSANQIAKNLDMDRTLTYTILNHLITKGQVNYIVKENKKFFSCSNPENLLNSVKAKEALIQDLVDELKKLKVRKQEETEIDVYEGKEGIRNLMREMTKVKHIDAFGATGRAYDLLFESPALGKEAEKKKVTMRILTNKKHKGKEFFKFKNIRVKFLDVESEATTSIFGDCIAIHLIKDKPIVIIIKNKDIANSYRNYFEWMWKRAR